MKSVNGFFASTLSDDEFAAFDSMTKAELAALYVDAQVEAGVIGEPADRSDIEDFVARNNRKLGLIDGIVMFRDMTNSEDDSDTYLDITDSIADATMTLEDSGDIRMGDDAVPTRSFAETWRFPWSVLDDDIAHQWTDYDQSTLDEMDALWGFEMDDEQDADIVDEWTEWLVLAGELERVDSNPDGPGVWAWCPDHRAEVPGCDEPIYRMDKAKSIFDAYDPLGLWFSKRHAEAMAGYEPQIQRRFEVDLVCQTCSRYSNGLISVRDDAVRLSKEFDVDGDLAAQTLIRTILSHI